MNDIDKRLLKGFYVSNKHELEHDSDKAFDKQLEMINERKSERNTVDKIEEKYSKMSRNFNKIQNDNELFKSFLQQQERKSIVSIEMHKCDS